MACDPFAALQLTMRCREAIVVLSETMVVYYAKSGFAADAAEMSPRVVRHWFVMLMVVERIRHFATFDVALLGKFTPRQSAPSAGIQERS